MNSSSARVDRRLLPPLAAHHDNSSENVLIDPHAGKP